MKALLKRLVVAALIVLPIGLGGAPTMAQQIQIPPEEYAALVALYNITDGAHWRDPWTLPTDEPCLLSGVRCSEGHVTQLSLASGFLKGSIPPELGDLASLQSLKLSNNQLSGPIPRELGDLVNLQELALYINQLSGPIPPELSNLTHLKWLYLASNQLSGSIPPELGNLTSLEELYLQENQLGGPLPRSLMNLHPFVFMFGQTKLCEPPDPDFQAWLAGLPNARGTNVLCKRVTVPLLSGAS